jgi:hypothetical protein
MIERWGLVGDISVKTWIDVDDFLPQSSRVEGKLADMYLLQMVEYSDFNVPLELSVPAVITKQVTEEKDALKKKMNSLAESVSQIRGWQEVKDIKMEFIDRVAFGEFLASELQKVYSQEKLLNEGLIMKLLGLLPKDADYEKTLLTSQITSIAGVYDPGAKKILLGDWVYPRYADAVLIHEIAHAFQDKQFDMGKSLAQKAGDDNLDASLAYRSLVEGDATAIMLEYLLKEDGKSFRDLDDIFSLIEEKIFGQSEYGKENLLYNIYGYGANFIQNYLKQFTWQDLDKAYEGAALSMKDIIHPEQFTIQQEDEDANRSRIFQESVFKGWEKIYEANLGEFLLLLSLRQAVYKESAEQSAAGWRHDTVTIYENLAGNKLIYFISQWSSADDATEFLKAYTQWVKKKYPNASLEENDGYSLLATDDGQLFSYMAEENSVKIVWSAALKSGEFKSLTTQVITN